LKDGRLLLKKTHTKGEPRRKYFFPGKVLEGEETLELALVKGFYEDVGIPCTVGGLSYVVESFRPSGGHEVGIYFLISTGQQVGRLDFKGRAEYVALDQLDESMVHPWVLVGKLSADLLQGRIGSASYLLSFEDI